MKARLTLGLIILVLFLVGIWAFKSSLGKLGPGIASRTWPSIPGHVTNHKIEAYEVTNHGDSGETYTRYRPAVNYNFRVYDHTYQGTRVRIGEPGFKTKAGASRLLQKLTDDSQCQVFYDPYDPNNCTLVKGVDVMTLVESVLALLGGIIAFAAGGFLIFVCIPKGNWKKFRDTDSDITTNPS